MKESIHKYFKLGTLQWMSFPNSAPLDALTAIARDDFFDAVEIKSYGAEKEQAKAILDQSHLTVAFGAHPMQLKDKLNPNALDESERQKAEDALKGAIDDLSHIPITHENTRFVIRTLRPYITHFHYGNAVADPNCDGYGDKHPRFGYPNSANDTKELLDFLRILKEEGFFNAESPYILSAEVTLRPGEDEQIVLANTKRVLNRAWALLED